MSAFFKPFECEPRSLSIVFVALPDLRNKRGLGAVLIDEFEQLHPVDLAILNLETFAINVFGIRKMQVSRERKNLSQKLAEWRVQVIAGEFGMGHIKTDPHALVTAELRNEGAVDEQIVKALPTEMPGEGWHGLRDDLHFTRGVEDREAFFEPLMQWGLLMAIEMTMLRETTNVGDQQHRFWTTETGA